MAHRPQIKCFHGSPSEIEGKFTLWSEEQMGCATILSVTQSESPGEDGKPAVTLTVLYEEDQKAVAERLRLEVAGKEEGNVPLALGFPIPGTPDPGLFLE